jgi:hypothetical protein
VAGDCSDDAVAARATMSIIETEAQMATYVVLSQFTDQGVRGVKDSPKRAAAFKAAAKTAGATVKAFYWTLGKYDMVSILARLRLRPTSGIKYLAHSRWHGSGYRRIQHDG